MRLRAVLREAGWLTRTSHVFGAVFVFAIACPTFGVTTIQAQLAADAVDQEGAALADGRDVWIHRRDESGLAAATCRAVSQWSAVLASGGVGVADVAGEDRVVPVSGQMPWILDHDVPADSLVALGPGVAQPPVVTRSTDVLQEPVRLDAGPRTESFTNAVLVRKADLTAVQECWVEFAPDPPAPLRTAVGQLLAGAGTPVEPEQLTDASPRADILAALSAHRTSDATSALSAISVGFIVLAALSRRRELALYRDLGWSKTEGLALLVISAYTHIVPAMAFGATCATAVLAHSDPSAEVLEGPSASALLHLGVVVAAAVPWTAAAVVFSITTADRR